VGTLGVAALTSRPSLTTLGGSFLSISNGFLKTLAFWARHRASGLFKNSIALFPPPLGTFGVDLVKKVEELDQFRGWQAANVVDYRVCHRAHGFNLDPGLESVESAIHMRIGRDRGGEKKLKAYAAAPLLRKITILK
jgi:hypothetical protein